MQRAKKQNNNKKRMVAMVVTLAFFLLSITVVLSMCLMASPRADEEYGPAECELYCTECYQYGGDESLESDTAGCDEQYGYEHCDYEPECYDEYDYDCDYEYCGDRYELDDEYDDDCDYESAVRTTVAMPSLAHDSFVFSGEGHTVSLINGVGALVIAGTLSATNAGNYHVTVALTDTDNYKWADGTDGEIVLSWNIVPAMLNPASPSDIVINFGDYDNLHDFVMDGWRWVSANQALTDNGEGESCSC